MANERALALGLRLALSAASLAVFAALLGVGELVARRRGPEDPATRFERDFLDSSLRLLGPCYRREGDRLVLAGAAQSPRSRARSVPAARTPGVPRIVVVGESSADMLAVALEAALRQGPCGRRYEVLNCALPGSGLEHLERRFEEALDAQPDAVVVTFGHNLRFALPTDALRIRARRVRLQSRLFTALGALFDQRPHASNAPLAARLPRFEDFLRRASREARARHAGLVVTTMASNLWSPPSAPRVERERDDALDARFTEAVRGPAAAAAAFAPSDDPLTPAYRDFMRGVLLARAHDRDGARRSLERALARDTLATRAAPAVNDTIRRVAAAEGFALRDTAQAIEAAAPMGLPGWESFSDACHLRPGAMEREAVAVFAAARPALGLPDACGATTPPMSWAVDLSTYLRAVRSFAPDESLGAYEAVALRVEARRRSDPDDAADEVARYLDATPSPPPAALAALAEGTWRAGAVDEALALNARARDAAAWAQLGLFRLRQRDAVGAAEALQRALAMDPQRADARRWRARLGDPPFLP